VDLLSGLQSRHTRAWVKLGNVETRLLAERMAATPIVKPIYIAGLARSGTTILLELLARHPDLASHRYRDFPPVLTPWLWNWFVDRAAARPGALHERAHGDGIQVTPESPEAFEEVVWMAFFEGLHDPNTNAVLDGQSRNPRFERFYRDHIRKLLLVRGGRRYLSKANYNLTRLAYLQKIFPDARFLMPIREPVWHIASLMQQHRRFCREHGRDVRLQRHMSRSGHFEFGLDRRPLNWGDAAATREILERWRHGAEVEGWALYWAGLHGHVVDVLEHNPELRKATLVLRYEALCSRPVPTLEALASHCDLPSADPIAAAAQSVRHPSYYQPGFSAAERAFIETHTSAVLARLNSLVTV
jgi:hypothetical protein